MHQLAELIKFLLRLTLPGPSEKLQSKLLHRC